MDASHSRRQVAGEEQESREPSSSAYVKHRGTDRREVSEFGSYSVSNREDAVQIKVDGDLEKECPSPIDIQSQVAQLDGLD